MKIDVAPLMGSCELEFTHIASASSENIFRPVKMHVSYSIWELTCMASV